jgi:hypothetical protein
MGSPPPSTRVVQAVAEASNQSAQELNPTLHDVVDPDALDALMANTGTPVTVSFSYAGFDVRVSGDVEGTSISVRPEDEVNSTLE